MSALGDALSAQQQRVSVTGPPKALQAAREALEPSEQALLDDWIAGPRPADELADVLTRNGFPVSASSIRTYRRALRRESEQA